MTRRGTQCAAWPAADTREAGISMVELLVAMMLTIMAAAIVMSLFISSTRSVAIASATHVDTGAASNIMNEASRVIRSGVKNQVAGVDSPALVIAQPRLLQLYSLVDMDPASAMRPVKVEFSVNAAGNLVEKRWQATLVADGSWTFPASAPLFLTRTVPGAILPHSTANPFDLFSYVRADGTVLTAPAGGLSASQLADIVAVRLSLAVRAEGSTSAHPAVLVKTIGMPNTGVTRADVP